jgi:4-hydroxy-4-methyl-2-oxoglutarate aldolase
LAGVPVRPGDLVFGDENGVLIVPREHVETVLETAELVKRTEEQIIAAVRAGQDPVEAHEAVRYDQMLKN